MGAIDTEKVAQDRYRLLAEKRVADRLSMTPAEVRRAIVSPGNPYNAICKAAVAAIACKLQVDDVLMANWVADPQGDYKKALNDLVTWNIAIHDNPAVSEIARARQTLMEALQKENRELHAAKRIAERSVALACDQGGHPDNQAVLIDGYRNEAMQQLVKEGILKADAIS